MKTTCKNVSRSIFFGALITLSGITAQAAEKLTGDVIKVQVIGTIRTGLMAIGGETTGTTITSNGVTWELDVGKDAKLQKLANSYNGRKAMVRGIYQRRKGIEIGQREIVTVTGLHAVPKSSPPTGKKR